MFLLVSGASAVIAALAMFVTAYAARRSGRVSVVDVTWGVTLAVVALACAVLGDSSPARRWLLVVLVGLWGLRLSWHIFKRSRGHGEDPRYATLLAAGPGGALLKVWIPQGISIWFVSWPLQVAAVADGRLGVVAWIGVALWVVGVLFESLGDAQLAAYKADPDRGPVMDRGLWGWTRHPNYFGDACVWWGLWLIAADVWPGVLTIASPIVMTYFLVFATGARLLEKTMMKRPGYPAYAARTSMFFPLPPKTR
ncbi:MAG: putative rane protein [Marmoricola sp.]|nr:putative rane protein [Marmoricola sp.]